MRIYKRVFSLLLVLCLMFTVSVSALAVDYTASNFGELEAAFGDSSGEDVNIDVSADISFDSNLSAKDGITYTIGSQSGSALVNARFDGSGDVIIHTALKGNEDHALSTDGEVSVTATGDISSDYAGVIAEGSSSITVKGDIEVAGVGVYAYDESSVTVNGNVSGGDGNPGDVNFDDPESYSDGANGVCAYDKATVVVNGNVSGGDSYGTYGYGSDGIYAYDESSVTVTGNVTGGNVTADPETSGEIYHSLGGTAIIIDGSANVTVNGNVSGGSTNGDFGTGGYGIHIESTSETPAVVTVKGSVTGGKASAENGTDGSGIIVMVLDPEPSTPPSEPPSEPPMAEPALPVITVGSVDTFVSNLPEEEHKALEESILVTGEDEPDDAPSTGTGDEAPTAPAPMADLFWQNVARQIRECEKGDELTVNAAHRTTMPSFIPELVEEYGITLTIQWDGGEDIVLTGEVDIPGDIIKLSELV